MLANGTSVETSSSSSDHHPPILQTFVPSAPSIDFRDPDSSTHQKASVPPPIQYLWLY